MLIQYCSDLHQEFSTNRRWLNDHPLLPEGDILIIAGDTHPLGRDFGRLRLWDYLAQNFRETYVLPGNHEYYRGYEVSIGLSETKEAIRPNVWLVNNWVVEKPEVRLIFTTLWSRIEKRVAEVLMGMMDFRKIRYEGRLMSIDYYNQLHEHALAFLKKELQTKSAKKRVVVSHHLPSELCNDEEYQGSALNEAFCVDLTSLIERSPIDAWIYGHSHRNVSSFEISGTHMLTNQLGYVNLKEHTHFSANATINLGEQPAQPV